MSRRGRVGFTTRASCLLAAGATAVVCGVALGETDLLRAGLFAAAIPIVAAIFVHRAQFRIANRRTVEPRQVVAGESVTVNLTITNRSVLPSGALMLEDELPGRIAGRARFTVDSLTSHEARTVAYRLPGLGRGRYGVGPLRLRLTDPFRMVDVTRSFTQTSEFLVTPAIDQLPPVEPPRSDDVGGRSGSHSVGAHGADDASTREYRTGDDLRKIHWRSTARTGSLMVRQEERPWRAISTVLLDLRRDAHATRTAPAGGTNAHADPRGTSSLEWAVSAAASIATQALRGGREVGLVDEPTQRQRFPVASADQLATHLALVRENRAEELAMMSELIRAAARDSALVAVLGRLTPGDLRLLADANPRGRVSPALALVLDVDSWIQDEAHAGAVPTGSPDRPLAPGSAHGAARSAAVLQAAGWRVQVVRRGMTTAQAWDLLLAGGGPALGRRSLDEPVPLAARLGGPR